MSPVVSSPIVTRRGGKEAGMVANVSREVRASGAEMAGGVGIRVVVENGVLSGMLGALVVALWFLVLDFARGAPLHTPSMLGSVLFRGVPVEEAAGMDPGMVFAYTGLHGVLFLAAGLVISWMFSQFEENPQLGMVLLLLFLLFESILLAFEVSVVPRLVGALGTWAVGLANLFSAAAMFWFLLRRRPEALARLRTTWEE